MKQEGSFSNEEDGAKSLEEKQLAEEEEIKASKAEVSYKGEELSDAKVRQFLDPLPHVCLIPFCRNHR